MRLFKYALVSLLMVGWLLPHATVSHAKESGFQLVILKQDWHDLRLGYTYDTAFPALQAADLSDPLFTVNLETLDSVDWACQSLTLTSEASQALIEVLPVSDKAPIAELMALKESLGWGNPVESALYIHGFVVLLDDELLYGGIFLDPISQMAIDFPVIRSEIIEGQIVFHVLPTHIPFVTNDPVACAAPAWEDSLTPEITGDWAQFSDEMKAAFQSFATTPTSNAFRETLHDERLYDILKAEGKLTE